MTETISHHEVFIHPGEFYFGAGDIRITTLLGSCVAITLWHPRLRHGGMCHYLLDSRGVILDQLDGRFADEALELFMIELRQRGTRPVDYQVKVFGGGSMLGDLECVDGIGAVGEVNIAAARHLLRRYGFEITSEHVGGHGFRYVMLDLWNGDVWMRYQHSAPVNGRKK